ncbi:MAG: hypothetical protein Ct9H300mP7_3770 [Verrucomicrobiota bacterium]|nr:MAG: hypothetical protein Ct9H300mP7_3770 [Verrucomicrobiota bacterium]
MKGYLNADANEAFQALGGWYDTGDIIHVDTDGYFWVRGRAKRFAKVSGEMVSLTAVEDALAGAFPQHGEECEVAVVALPDAEKGERLVAVTNEPKLELAEIREAITAAGLTNLYAPRDLQVVDELPKLGPASSITARYSSPSSPARLEPCFALSVRPAFGKSE